MKSVKHIFLTTVLAWIGFVTTLNAQDNVYKEVETLDGIIEALYGSISGEQGQPRDWDKFRALFYPGAQLIPTGFDTDGKRVANFTSVEEFIERAETSFKQNGFFEVEIHRATEEYGPMVHVFSTYESTRSPDDVEPFNRGINSIQVFNDGARWWIINIFWAHEPHNETLPARYLPNN